jgi:hypothetical protein
MLIARIGAPSNLRGIGALIYDNKNMPAMKIRVGGGDVIGPIQTGDMVIFSSDCKTGNSSAYVSWY